MTTSSRDASRTTTTPYRSSLRVSGVGVGAGSPLTPHARLTSASYSHSNVSSPGSALHQVDEPLVFEVGTRFLRAGFANEATPRCTIGVMPEHFGRVGLKGRGGTRKDLRSGDKAGPMMKGSDSSSLELWAGELRDRDLGVVEDVLERLLREAYNKYLLIDSKSKRLLISLSPLLPIPLQTRLAQLLFTHFQPPAITFISSPVLSTISAGLRSALVVDIGWHETTATPVYELRPITSHLRSSNRASKHLLDVTGQLIWNAIKDQDPEESWWTTLDYENVEDLLVRGTWCRSHKEAKEDARQRVRRALGLPAVEEVVLPERDEFDDDEDEYNRERQAELSKPPDPVDAAIIYAIFTTLTLKEPKTALDIPFKSMSATTELAFFTPSSTIPTIDASILDDDIVPLPDAQSLLDADYEDPDLEDDGSQTLPQLIFKTLLNSPIDIRAACIPRIVITGSAAKIPGLKPRLIAEVAAILSQRGGWDPVRPRRIYGAVKKERLIQKEENVKIVELLESQKEEMRIEHRETGGVPRGTVRGVQTLGPWAGGSMLAGAKIRGVVEIEREKFLAAVASGGSGFS